ncbi:MAG: NADH-quinone oxidoreductase subunit NuoE [Roseiarcus sp.]|uniref:NADH-quinone oxidoreductase subunit NuoE n=1 Tax=Roseiarcus sp. TaxID=1969460 RepID=UPI003BAF7413
MSVRRLADQQPESFGFTPENEAWAATEIAKYPAGRQASAVLALLWRAQAQSGYWLSKPAIEKVARMLDMPKIRVLEVATFYSMFNLAPVGRYYVQLCGTTPCMLRGAEDIKAVLRKRVGESGHVTADGLFSWNEVECLGACCNAPMVQINDDYYEDLTPQSFSHLLDDLAAGRPVRTGSQIGRKSSEPVGGLTSLTTLYGVDGLSGKASVASQAPANDQPAHLDEGAAHAHAAAEEAHISEALAKLPADATAEQKANAVGARPLALEAPRGAADDLQRVKGVGPVNEKHLHDLGVFHFDQIAAWTTAEIRWVGTYLAFPGRIDREQWVAQAANLARGGTSSKVVGGHGDHDVKAGR